jgi:ribosomal protein L29
MSKSIDLSALTDEQLVHTELNAQRDLAAQQLRHVTGKLENNSLLGKARRAIARAQTEIRRRELAAGDVNGALRTRHLGSYKPQVLGAVPEAGGAFLKNVLDGAGAAE